MSVMSVISYLQYARAHAGFLISVREGSVNEDTKPLTSLTPLTFRESGERTSRRRLNDVTDAFDAEAVGHA